VKYTNKIINWLVLAILSMLMILGIDYSTHTDMIGYYNELI
jgi:CHASE3 domain sensor protein